MRSLKWILTGAVVLFLFLVCLKHYLGYYNYWQYKGFRENAESMEKGFPEMERLLQRACRFAKNPLFYKELGRINLEMAIAENQFGEEARRDAYLDQAGETLLEQIRRNPADALGYYRMGQVYMLYNYPLMTYMGKGRLYFRRALELDPSDEPSNLNVLYIFLTQWPYLTEDEKSFVFERLDRMAAANESFIRQLRNRWIENFGDEVLLKAALIENKNLWSKIDKYF